MSSVNNIARFREARGWQRPELAKRMGTTPQQVERLEKGQRKLTQDWIDRAAEALEVKPADIITAGMPVDNLPAIQPDIPPTRPISPADETVEIMQLDLRFSMGPGTNIDDYIEETPARFSLDLIRSFTRTPPTRLRRASGVGDSMFPTLQSSDAVWIDTTQRMLNQQDRVWAISLYGAAAIKRLRTIGSNKILVISDNPAVPDQEVDAEDLIIGGRIIRLERDI